MQLARVRRRAMLKLRDSARVCVVARPIGSLDARPQLTACLVGAGLTTHQVLSYQAAVSAYAVGWVAYEQSQALYTYLTQPDEESFEAGLRARVNGFT